MNQLNQSGYSASSDSATKSALLVDCCLRLRQRGTRLLPGLGFDDELWILVGPERDNDWNQWIVALHDDDTYNGEGEFVVRRAVWWWGEYKDTNEELTEAMIGPMLRSTARVEPAR